MTFKDKMVSGPGFNARAIAEGDSSFELEVGGKIRMKFGRVRCAEFSESNALAAKLRRHAALDGLSNSLEMAGVIPFGCEYHVERELELIDGVGSCVVDVSAVNRGAVGSVALEDVTFPGPWTRMEYLVYGASQFASVTPGAEQTEFYRGDEPLVMVRLTAEDGVKVEHACGSDLWRHRAAKRMTGVEAEFVLSGNAREIGLTRQVVRYLPETVIEKRPWRFKNVFGWSLPGEEPAAITGGIDFASFAVPASGMRVNAQGGGTALPCPVAAVTRKAMREAVRKSDGVLEFSGVEVGLCYSAAHQERPGKKELEHFELGEWIDFYLWSNRQLKKRGGKLRVGASGTGLFADSVCFGNLGRFPRSLDDEPEME